MTLAGWLVGSVAFATSVLGLTAAPMAQEPASPPMQAALPEPMLAPQSVQLFGHVTLLQAYDLPHFQGTWALVQLSDYTDTVVALFSDSRRIQTLLETALATGNLMYFVGRQYTNPPLPKGGTTVFDVFSPDEVTVFTTP